MVHSIAGMAAVPAMIDGTYVMINATDWGYRTYSCMAEFLC